MVLSFAMFFIPGLDSVSCVYAMCFGRLFLVSNLSSCFSVVGFHSPSFRLFLFFSCFPWYLCGVNLSELWSLQFKVCGSLLECAPCMCLFSLWSASYLLAGGCASGALGMCLPVLWWPLFSGDDFSGPLFWLFALVIDRTPLCSKDFFVSDFIFYFFSDICLF